MQKRIVDHEAAHEALHELGAGLMPDDDWIHSCEAVEPLDIPDGPRQLLVHEAHMTATLAAFYREPIALEVLKHQRDADVYRRKIILTVHGGQSVVEFGLVRLDLAATDNSVQDRIIERQAPLGDILNQHRILTRIQPLWFLRFANGSPLVQYFRPPPVGPLFGRIGMIYFEGTPAVELMEVVRGDSLRTTPAN